MNDEAVNMARTPEEAWALLVAVSLAGRRSWLEASQAEGLTPPQAMSLMALRADQPGSLGQLARKMHCDASYATALADRLEERGLVERRISATDRRVKELVPTDRGMAAQRRLRSAFAAPPAGLDDLPDEDRRALVRIAAHLAARVDPDVLGRVGVLQHEDRPG